MQKLTTTVLAALLLWCSTVFGQSFKNEFGFKSENDAYLFYGQDRYYTNGLFINFRHALDQQKLKGSIEKVIYEVEVGQQMYNPISGYAPNLIDHDRPFAGYLYGGGKLSLFYTKETVLKGGIQLGTVGPRALGREAQELLHDIVGFYDIDGWQYQIRNELAVNLSAQYLKLLHRSGKQDLDFSLETNVNAGTTFAGVGAGILFRTGKINQLFNSSYTNAVISNNSKTKRLVESECYFYAKPQLHVILHDSTIEGSMFTSESPVTFEAKPLVFAQQVGFNYSSQRFTFDFGLTFKSKEVKSIAKAHQYGSISMFYRFN